jgi:hypothetical protein
MPDKWVKTSVALKESTQTNLRHYAIDAKEEIQKIIDVAIVEYMKNHPLKKEKSS